MLRLLVLFALTIVIAALNQAVPASATGPHVYLYLYHPTGNSTSSAVLTCGWHYNCDGNPNESNKIGLDWVYPAGNPSTDVWFRAKGCCTSPNTWVARGRAYMSQFTGCNGIVTDITRISDGALFGQVWALHSQKSGGDIYFNIYAGNGQTNEASIGYFGPLDACSSFTHTMQWYQSGLYDDVVSKNGPPNIPNEDICSHWSNPPCMISYNRWTTAEYIFGFTS